jgi:hypothetical protein
MIPSTMTGRRIELLEKPVRFPARWLLQFHNSLASNCGSTSRQ